MRVVGLDVGGSSIKAWVMALDGRLLGRSVVPTVTQRPAPHRAEFDPAGWELACRAALSAALEQAGPGEDVGVTVSSMRQAFVLLGADGTVLGPGVLNSDRRGGPYTAVLTGRYELTGHWPAPELTLPKLLAVRAEEPERWASTRRVLFVHDWLLWLLAGVQVTEASYAGAGGMAAVAARDWAYDLLADCGLPSTRLAPVIEAGTVVGHLGEGWPLRPGLPVVSGCGDTQLAAMGAGGLAAGVVTVVAGSSTPVQAATASPVLDPQRRPWVSTHAAPDLWAAEGNAGYPGSFSGWWAQLAGVEPADDPGEVLAVTGAELWSQGTWEHKPPWSLVGLSPASTAEQVARALLEAHAFAIRGNLEDLERACGERARAVVLAGGGVQGPLAGVLADALGRDLHVGTESGAAPGGTALVARALGLPAPALELPHRTVSPSRPVSPAGDDHRLDDRYHRWRTTTAALRTGLGD